jgi:AcrR family transcriptional regulator
MTSPRRRPGPRRDVDIRDCLVQAAETMFGDLTVDAVSLRAVAREAGVAPRALTYHFPTKRDLVAAVLDRRSGVVGDAISHRLNHLAKDVAEVNIEDVVEAVVIPFADMLNVDPRGGLRWMKIFATLALSEDEIWAGRLGDTVEAYLAAAGKALPDVASEQARTRARIAMFSVINALACSDRAAYGSPLRADGLDDRWVAQLVAYTSAGLANSAH